AGAALATGAGVVAARTARARVVRAALATRAGTGLIVGTVVSGIRGASRAPRAAGARTGVATRRRELVGADVDAAARGSRLGGSDGLDLVCRGQEKRRRKRIGEGIAARTLRVRCARIDERARRGGREVEVGERHEAGIRPRDGARPLRGHLARGTQDPVVRACDDLLSVLPLGRAVLEDAEGAARRRIEDVVVRF